MLTVILTILKVIGIIIGIILGILLLLVAEILWVPFRYKMIAKKEEDDLASKTKEELMALLDD